MRAISFRYRFECELVNKDTNVMEHYFTCLILSLKQIEDLVFKRVHDTKQGTVTILGITARDQFSEYIDEACVELYENDRCMDELERMGYIELKNGQWVWVLEDGKEALPLDKHYWHLRKIGTRWGDDAQGELRRYDMKGFEEIM